MNGVMNVKFKTGSVDESTIFTVIVHHISDLTSLCLRISEKEYMLVSLRNEMMTYKHKFIRKCQA